MILFISVAEDVSSPNVCDTHTWKLGKFQFRFISTTRNRGVKAGYQILSWAESQNQVFHALRTVISYLLP